MAADLMEFLYHSGVREFIAQPPTQGGLQMAALRSPSAPCDRPFANTVPSEVVL
jgi:hypothetical protein